VIAKNSSLNQPSSIPHQAEFAALARQMAQLLAKDRQSLISLFAELLRPYGLPPTPLHEVLHEGAKLAGWSIPRSANAQRRQQVAARARQVQREEDLAHRRVLVAYLFRQLRPGLQKRPASLGTAQAVIGRLQKLPFDRTPPMTVRTIQEDIRFMKKNGNFGI
jgi:hypothetical protein